MTVLMQLLLAASLVCTVLGVGAYICDKGPRA